VRNLRPADLTALPLFPLDAVLVPNASLRLHIFEDRYKSMIGRCIEERAPFGVVLETHGRETGDELDPATVGTAAQIAEVTRLPQGRMHIVARGTRRFRVERFLQSKPFWAAQVSYLDDETGPIDAALRLQAAAEERFRDYLQALLHVSGGELDQVELPADPGATSFAIADVLAVPAADKQTLLESPSAAQRLSEELRLLERETRRLRARAASDEGEVDDAQRRRNAITVRISLN
jgi:Lon protease-like protein